MLFRASTVDLDWHDLSPHYPLPRHDGAAPAMVSPHSSAVDRPQKNCSFQRMKMCCCSSPSCRRTDRKGCYELAVYYAVPQRTLQHKK